MENKEERKESTKEKKEETLFIICNSFYRFYPITLGFLPYSPR